MSKLNIDKEFQELLPPLNTEEKNKLSESIRQNGLQEPIVIWEPQNIILDGHNRYEICTQLGMEIKTRNMSFETRESAKLWMLKNQLGRRNLNAFHRTRVQLMIVNLEKNLGENNADEKNPEKSIRPEKTSGNAAEKKNIFQEVAMHAGVSPETVRKINYLEENINDDVRKKLMRGETSISKEYAALKERRRVEQKPLPKERAPHIYRMDAVDFLNRENQENETYDLLLSEPPKFSEWNLKGDLPEYAQFYKDWLALALSCLKPTSHGFIFADTDPSVLNQLLSISLELKETKELPVSFEDLLIWTFRPAEQIQENSASPFQKNWQGILYFKGKNAQAPVQKNMYGVLHYMKDISNDYKYKDWRKPIRLLQKIAHFAPEGGSVIDPFAGSGHFLNVLARAGLVAKGAEVHPEMISLAIENDCVIESAN